MSEYIQGINAENLAISILSGTTNIQDISLNPSLMESLNMPCKLIQSRIKKISLKLPWKNLTKEAIEINIEGCYLQVRADFTNENSNN